MITSIDTEKAFEKNPTHIYDFLKKSQQTRSREEIPQLEKEVL